MFAHELGLQYAFSPVLNLMSSDSRDYAGNPALKLPVLTTDDDAVWYGTLNICRELQRRSQLQRTLVWPEQLTSAISGNAQELVLHAMSAEVGLIMGSVGDAQPGPYALKSGASLRGALTWLDQHWASVLDALPAQRDLSFLEVTAFCLMTHLEFRQVLDVSSFASLARFVEAFGKRDCALATPYHFDPA
jgi:glutathione S-transferase